MEAEIRANFARRARGDCNSAGLAEYRAGVETSVADGLARLTACMSGKCTIAESEFLACFDKERFEKQFKACEPSYKGVANVQLLREEFAKSIVKYKRKFCNENYGTFGDDEICRFTFGFGATQSSIQKTQQYQIGDAFICNQSRFGVIFDTNKIGVMMAKKDLDVAILRGVGTLLNMGAAGIGLFKDAKCSAAGNGGKVDGWGKLSIGLSTVGIVADGFGPGLEIFMNAKMLEAMEEALDMQRGFCFVIKGDERVPIMPEEYRRAEDEKEEFFVIKWTGDWVDQAINLENEEQLEKYKR